MKIIIIYLTLSTLLCANSNLNFQSKKNLILIKINKAYSSLKNTRDCIANASTKNAAIKCATVLKKDNLNKKYSFTDSEWNEGKKSILKEFDKGLKKLKKSYNCTVKSTSSLEIQKCNP